MLNARLFIVVIVFGSSLSLACGGTLIKEVHPDGGSGVAADDDAGAVDEQPDAGDAIPEMDAGTSGDSDAGTADAGGYDAGPQLPARVTIEIVSSMIAPVEVDGSPWDGFGSVPSDVSTALEAALAAVNPFAAVGAYLASDAVNMSVSGTSKPDPYGNAQIYLNGAWGNKITLGDANGNEIDDTFTPDWAGPPGWSQIPLTPTLRIQVSLSDDDISEDDPIGVAEINYQDILAALNAQQVWQVNVADQTQNQLLFIGISVAAQ